MLFVNQRDYPDVKYRTRTDVPEDPYGQNTTVKSSACGLASAMMALDPNLYDGKFEEEGREGKAELTGNLARCSEKVLLDEVEKIVRRSEAAPEKWSKAFHLFWRI